MRENQDMSCPLFETTHAKGRRAYKLYAASMAASICLTWWYRATHIPPSGEGRYVWLGMLAAEIWYGLYWILTQSVRWNPIYRRTFKERLAQRYANRLPGVDIFVCTADPVVEPPALVVSTVLSLMAYDYPPEKMSVYLSDDGGSILTFFALLEASQFAKHWVPFCKKFGLEPRSPAAFFSRPFDSSGTCSFGDWSSIKVLYEEMVDRINSAVMHNSIPEEMANHKGFSEWKQGMTSRDHPPIVQIITNEEGNRANDVEGKLLPTLVYMAREKRPQYPHNFKAGAMNALIRVSSEISNNPIILNVDCDMYSNNSMSIKDALCFFLDEDKGNNIGFIQYPQNFDNLMKNDLYGYGINTINEVELPGLDSWGGPLYIGTGCFHRRESVFGRIYTKDYKEEWMRGTRKSNGDDACTQENRVKNLATCAYELNTEWGKEIGLLYGCPVEDVLTGLAIQCRGWRSIYFNPTRKGFLGTAPTTLSESIVQHTRWCEGNFQIFLSKYCPLIYGHGRIKLGHQMAYSIYGLWAPNSIPTIYYMVIPSLCLLKGITLFPMISSLWYIPFVYVVIAKNVYALVESLHSGDTFKAWWNLQRMWLLRRQTSYLLGTIESILKLIGISNSKFKITTKVTNEDVSKRYKQEIMEFGSTSVFTIISTLAVFNFLSFLYATKRLVIDEGIKILEAFSLQILLSGMVVALSLPIYQGLFFRKDNGSMPTSVTVLSVGIAVLACLIPII